jgi:hypothetical protein
VGELTNPAPVAVIEKVAAAIRANNIDARVVGTAEEARRAVLELIPEGAEVHSGKSKTLADVGLFEELFESDRYDSGRARYMKMDRQTQGREIRKLIAAPDYMLGSVHAITESGDLVVASASASSGLKRAVRAASSSSPAARRSFATSIRPFAGSTSTCFPTRMPSCTNA